jgi:hypothetical protein
MGQKAPKMDIMTLKIMKNPSGTLFPNTLSVIQKRMSNQKITII